MTSPYIEREAAKLRLVHSAPPCQPRAGAHADHNPRDFHYPRTQREAGIEHLGRSPELAAFVAQNDPPDRFAALRRRSSREERLPVIRPWVFFAIAVGCWAIFALAVAWALSSL